MACVIKVALSSNKAYTTVVEKPASSATLRKEISPKPPLRMSLRTTLMMALRRCSASRCLRSSLGLGDTGLVFTRCGFVGRVKQLMRAYSHNTVIFSFVVL